MLLGIDVGTSSSKAVLVERDGTILASAHRDHVDDVEEKRLAGGNHRGIVGGDVAILWQPKGNGGLQPVLGEQSSGGLDVPRGRIEDRKLNEVEAGTGRAGDRGLEAARVELSGEDEAVHSDGHGPPSGQRPVHCGHAAAPTC